MYVNDIAISTNAKILSFADDTTLYVSHSNPTELFKMANMEMGNLFNWFCANKLSLNPDKTKYILIHAPRQKIDITDLTMTINGVRLKQIGNNLEEKSSKFLGIHLDECLTWKHHLNHVNLKISRALFAIKQIKHILPINSLRTLYYSMIHPHLSYGILAWGNAVQVNLNRTITIQKRAIRTINRASYNAHTDPLFKKCNILKLHDLYDYEVAQFMYRYHSNQLPKSFDNMFQYNYEMQVIHRTRQSHQMHIERCASNLSARLPHYNFPKMWNNLSLNIDNVSFFKFRKNLRVTMISSYLDVVKCQNQLCRDCYK